MKKMIEPLTIKNIKAAIHKWNLINKTYNLYYHPNDKEVIQEIIATQVGDNLLSIETSLVKPGHVLLIDRTKFEDYYEDIRKDDKNVTISREQ